MAGLSDNLITGISVTDHIESDHKAISRSMDLPSPKRKVGQYFMEGKPL